MSSPLSKGSSTPGRVREPVADLPAPELLVPKPRDSSTPLLSPPPYRGLGHHRDHGSHSGSYYYHYQQYHRRYEPRTPTVNTVGMNQSSVDPHPRSAAARPGSLPQHASPSSNDSARHQQRTIEPERSSPSYRAASLARLGIHLDFRQPQDSNFFARPSSPSPSYPRVVSIAPTDDEKVSDDEDSGHSLSSSWEHVEENPDDDDETQHSDTSGGSMVIIRKKMNTEIGAAGKEKENEDEDDGEWVDLGRDVKELQTQAQMHKRSTQARKGGLPQNNNNSNSRDDELSPGQGDQRAKVHPLFAQKYGKKPGWINFGRWL